MEKDIMDIVREKEFIALSVEEKAELSGICSNEDEFNNLKQVFFEVEGVAIASNVSPQKETKEQLDELFVSTYPKAAGVWYSSVLALVVPKNKPLHRQPLVQLAAVGLLVFLTVPFLNNTSIDSSEKQLVASEETVNEVKIEELMNEKDVEFKGLEFSAEDQKAFKEEVADLNKNPESISTSPDKLKEITSTVALSQVTPATSEHPDGIFEEVAVAVSYSIPTSEQPELLDLLTTTF